MGNATVKAGKPIRQNLWNSRSTKSDWQYWFWKYKDFRIVLAAMLYYSWDNPARLRFFEWNKEQTEFTKKQEEYEKMKYFEKNRRKYYDKRDLFLPEEERREITEDQRTDQHKAAMWSMAAGINTDAILSYKEATWKNREIAEGRHDDEVKKTMGIDDTEIKLDRVGKIGIGKNPDAPSEKVIEQLSRKIER